MSNSANEAYRRSFRILERKIAERHAEVLAAGERVVRRWRLADGREVACEVTVYPTLAGEGGGLAPETARERINDSVRRGRQRQREDEHERTSGWDRHGERSVYHRDGVDGV